MWVLNEVRGVQREDAIRNEATENNAETKMKWN